ncbi:MAG TPA: HepT-like ribonuclease domain-containing protein [Microbacterium sp.]|nr:HepT-like ribonuclease domain-containing protein [Microbacterium sp.]
MTDGEASRIERRLEDLERFIADAAYTVSLGVDAYLADTAAGRVLRNNGRHIVIQVATVAEKLPASFKEAHPDVDWVRIARMRNLIAHHYDSVNDHLVFSTLQHRLPELAETLGLRT